jgi:hypothetical protein
VCLENVGGRGWRVDGRGASNAAHSEAAISKGGGAEGIAAQLFRLTETACIHCLYKPVLGTELGKSSSAAFNSQTTLPKLVFTYRWDLANPNKPSFIVNVMLVTLAVVTASKVLLSFMQQSPLPI